MSPAEKFRINRPAPVTWCPLRRAVICDLCGENFKGVFKPNERSTFPMRNRARGNAIRHLNDTCPKREAPSE